MYGTDITNINYTLMFDGGSRGNPGICGLWICYLYE